MQKGIILFDIDRTIFDTDHLINLLYRNFSDIIDNNGSLGFKEFWENTFSGSKHITSEERLRLIVSTFGIKKIKPLLNIYYGKEFSYIYKDSVFPETFEVIEKLKDKYRLGVYSEGTKRFQNNKFKSMELDKYIENDLVFIFDHKTNSESLSKIPKEAIIVDDKESVCEYLVDNGLTAIWLNRKDNRKSDRFQTIHNLIELPPMLLNFL